MRRIFVVFALLMLTAFGNAFPAYYAPQSADTFETVKEFLLNSAATDFNEHDPPYPAKFRNVRIGHVGDTAKSGAYRMCGEFLPPEGGEKAEWCSFATIKTSGYEQYIGSSSTYCTDSKMVWDTADDLSSALKERLDSVKKKK